jgi:hypothetical protein
MYDFDKSEGERLTDLTPDPSDQAGADVSDGGYYSKENIGGVSEDGSYAYFSATGALAAGATAGVANSYVWHEGTGAHFIAPGNLFEGNDIETSLQRAWRVSPNGRFLAYESLANTYLAKTVYLYSAESNSSVCASCNPTGARPLGGSELPRREGGQFGEALRPSVGNGWETDFYQQRYLTNNGRLFFNSDDVFSPRDTNGQPDVYEYENGEVHLISGGFGSEPSLFYDASASENDVFFLTRDKLVAADQDEAVDLYDARVGGIPSVASPPPCASSDACKPGPTPQPEAFGAPASATFSGSGNVSQTAGISGGGVKQKGASELKAERLAKALRVCRSRPKGKRSGCEAAARKRYGSRAKAKAKGSVGRSGKGGRR